MSSTFFQDYNQNNPIVSAWLNDVNNAVYGAGGSPRLASSAAAAWVRFNITGGVVAIQQSVNIPSVVRTGVGVYVITYANHLTNAANCYAMSASSPGFLFNSAESVAGVTVSFLSTGSAAADPGEVGFMVFGAN